MSKIHMKVDWLIAGTCQNFKLKLPKHGLFKQCALSYSFDSVLKSFIALIV